MKKNVLHILFIAMIIIISTQISFGQYNTTNSNVVSPISTNVFDAERLAVEKMQIKYSNALQLNKKQQDQLVSINQKYLENLIELDAQNLSKSELRSKKLRAHHVRLFEVKSILKYDQTKYFRELIKYDMGGVKSK